MHHPVAANDAGLKNQEQEAQEAYLKAVGEQACKKDVATAEELYRGLLSSQGVLRTIRYRIRLASLSALKAKHVFWLPQKLKYVHESINRFNHLKPQVEAQEDLDLEYEYYMYRGRTYIHLPAFFHKRETAMSDLKKALDYVDVLNRPRQEVEQLRYLYREQSAVDKQ